jgi:hypothetical protein
MESSSEGSKARTFSATEYSEHNCESSENEDIREAGAGGDQRTPTLRMNDYMHLPS